MRSLDWKSILKVLAAYWLTLAPIYFLWRTTLPGQIEEAARWLPYLAAIASGFLYSYLSISARIRECVILAIAIGLSHLFADPAVTWTLSTLVDIVAASILFVCGGSALGDYLAIKKRT